MTTRLCLWCGWEFDWEPRSTPTCGVVCEMELSDHNSELARRAQEGQQREATNPTDPGVIASLMRSYRVTE